MKEFVSFGSKPDLQRHLHLHPLSGVKRTPNVRFLRPNDSLNPNVCFRGLSGRSRHGPKESAYSQKETFAGVEILSTQGPESTVDSTGRGNTLP